MSKRVCVIGLGYIGLPTAAMFAKSGCAVLGVDINARVIETLRTKGIHIEEPGLEELVRECVESGRLQFSLVPAEADAFIIAVPTPITADHRPDLTAVEAATEAIVPYLKPGNLVVVESTIPPGTITDIVAPRLERAGFVVGKDLYVVHSPERVLPGNLLREIVENSRIMGGINLESALRAKELYRLFVKGEISLTDATTAELVKLMENSFRDVNIALANEFARVAERVGVNVWEAIEFANRHPRVNILRPGPGVGGHCIAVDPWFIIDRCPEETRLLLAARQINDGVPEHVASVVERLVAGIDRPKVGVLGVAFKGNVDDMRESPAVHVVELLRSKGFELAVFDPHVKAAFPDRVDRVEACFEQADLVVVLTDHKWFANLDPERLRDRTRRPVVYDTRACLPQEKWRGAGFELFLIGDGRSDASLIQRGPVEQVAVASDRID